MASIFQFDEYRDYLNHWIKAKKSEGYGVKGQMAKAIGVSSSLISQIIHGSKTLTPDQSCNLSDFLGLNELESDFLHLLVELDRAGTIKYKDRIRDKIHKARAKSQKISQRVPNHKALTESQKAIFYSSWLYTGIRNLTAIGEYQTTDAIAERLNLETKLVRNILHFLLNEGLCKGEIDKITYGPARTHVDNDSPHVNKHHQNWRIHALQKMERKEADDLFFTSPVSLSKSAYTRIREQILAAIEASMKISAQSDSETVACLNIDWFRY